ARRPRLFLGDTGAVGLRARLDADAMLSRFSDAVVRHAGGYIDAAPPPRELVGGYPTMLSVSREYLRRVCGFAFAFLVTGDDRFARRAEDHMLVAAGFEDWVPWHFLDAAEMTASLAIGYDWLYDALPVESRAIIRQAIVEKGIDPSFELATAGLR